MLERGKDAVEAWRAKRRGGPASLDKRSAFVASGQKVGGVAVHIRTTECESIRFLRTTKSACLGYQLSDFATLGYSRVRGAGRSQTRFLISWAQTERKKTPRQHPRGWFSKVPTRRSPSRVDFHFQSSSDSTWVHRVAERPLFMICGLL